MISRSYLRDLISDLRKCKVSAPPEYPVHPRVCDKAADAIQLLLDGELVDNCSAIEKWRDERLARCRNEGFLSFEEWQDYCRRSTVQFFFDSDGYLKVRDLSPETHTNVSPKD